MRPQDVKTLSRSDLYTLVWAEPMSKIAPRFNLSDVGLKKICRKNRIPVPGRGYWRRVQTGRRVPQTPLPRMEHAPMIEIAVRPPAPPAPQGVVEQAQKEESPENRIVVPTRLGRPHAVTKATRDALAAQKPDEYGVLKCYDPKGFSVRVDPRAVARALRILDTLLKACEARGHATPQGTKEDGRNVRLVVNGEAVAVSLEERARRSPHELTAKERADRERSSWSWAPKYDYAPSGEMTIKIDGISGSGIRAHWSDGHRQRLEDCLNDVMVSLVHAAEWLRAERLKREEWHRRYQEEQARREALRRQLEQEREAIAKLEEKALAWQRARTIRAYVDAVEAKAHDKGALTDEQLQRIARARYLADRIDPLCDAPAAESSA